MRAFGAECCFRFNRSLKPIVFRGMTWITGSWQIERLAEFCQELLILGALASTFLAEPLLK